MFKSLVCNKLLIYQLNYLNFFFIERIFFLRKKMKYFDRTRLDWLYRSHNNDKYYFINYADQWEKKIYNFYHLN